MSRFCDSDIKHRRVKYGESLSSKIMQIHCKKNLYGVD